MKQWIRILIMLTFLSDLSLFAKEKGILLSRAEIKNDIVDLNQVNRLKLLGLSAAEFNALPKAVKRRIPDHLTKTDSLLINTDFQSATADNDQITSFTNGELNGSIINMGGCVYKVVDDKEHLLGVFRKSRDGKRYTLLNAKGDLLFNTQGGYGLFYAVISLFSIAASIVLYLLLANALMD